jgi:hypothetical protein
MKFNLQLMMRGGKLLPYAGFINMGTVNVHGFPDQVVAWQTDEEGGSRPVARVFEPRFEMTRDGYVVVHGLVTTVDNSCPSKIDLYFGDLAVQQKWLLTEVKE